MKTRVSLKYFVDDSVRKPLFDFNSPQTLSNLISLTILVTPRSFTPHEPKIRAIKFQNRAKICLTL